MNAIQTIGTALAAATGPGVGRMAPPRPLNCCHRCGATAYKTRIARDAAGAMRPSGQYECVQCKKVFSTVKAWRDGDDGAMGDAGAGQDPHPQRVN